MTKNDLMRIMTWKNFDGIRGPLTIYIFIRSPSKKVIERGIGTVFQLDILLKLNEHYLETIRDN